MLQPMLIVKPQTQDPHGEKERIYHASLPMPLKGRWKLMELTLVYRQAPQDKQSDGLDVPKRLKFKI